MFKHTHPYQPYIPKGSKKLIVGTLPPPRFTTGDLKDGDVDFCYGSRDGQLWIILNRIFKLNLKFETTEEAIQQRKNFLINNQIGICDMVDYAMREKIDASDLGMKEVNLRDMVKILREHPSVETLLFTGGNSKNGPEYFFRKHLRSYPNIQLKKLSDEVPRIHQFNLDNRVITTVSLTAPSGAANRAVGAMAYFKYLKQKNPKMNTLDFRVLQYQPYFK